MNLDYNYPKEKKISSFMLFTVTAIYKCNMNLFFFLFFFNHGIVFPVSIKISIPQLISCHFLIYKAEIQGSSHIWTWWVHLWQGALAHATSSSWNMSPLIIPVTLQSSRCRSNAISSAYSLPMWSFIGHRNDFRQILL